MLWNTPYSRSFFRIIFVFVTDQNDQILPPLILCFNYLIMHKSGLLFATLVKTMATWVKENVKDTGHKYMYLLQKWNKKNLFWSIPSQQSNTYNLQKIFLLQPNKKSATGHQGVYSTEKRRHKKSRDGIVIAIDMATTTPHSRIIVLVEKLRMLQQRVSSCLNVAQKLVECSTARI